MGASYRKIAGHLLCLVLAGGLALFASAGYELRGTTLVERRTGRPFSFEIMVTNRDDERLARRLLGEAVGQRRLSEDTHADAAAGGSSAPIAETHRDMRLILADWRDAERRLSESREGSHEAAGAASDVERHRIEYQAAFSDARRRGE